MVAIWIVSAIHLWWGFCLLILVDVPRPFGSLEPYLLVADQKAVGVILMCSGTLPLLYFTKWFRCFVCLTIPQQLILTWSLALTFVDATSFDSRSLLALGYVLPLTIAHFSEMIMLFSRLILVEKVEKEIIEKAEKEIEDDRS